MGGGHGRDGGHYDGGSTGREFVQGLQHNHAGKDLDSSCAVDFVPFIRIWLLDCEDLIGGLALQTAAGHVKFPIATWLQMSVEIIFTEGSQVERCVRQSCYLFAKRNRNLPLLIVPFVSFIL